LTVGAIARLGANRSSPVILVERLELLGSKKEDEANSFSGGNGM
jgi:single-strand DNA-binding protein